jgi:hypothetical protein
VQLEKGKGKGKGKGKKKREYSDTTECTVDGGLPELRLPYNFKPELECFSNVSDWHGKQRSESAPDSCFVSFQIETKGPDLTLIQPNRGRVDLDFRTCGRRRLSSTPYSVLHGPAWGTETATDCQIYRLASRRVNTCPANADFFGYPTSNHDLPPGLSQVDLLSVLGARASKRRDPEDLGWKLRIENGGVQQVTSDIRHT